MNILFFTASRAHRRGVPRIESIHDPNDLISFEGVKAIDDNTFFEAKVSGTGGWTDCLNSYPSLLPLVLSETVVREIDSAGIRGARFTPLKLKLAKGLKRNSERYYCLLPEGRPLSYRRRYFRRGTEGKKDRLVCEIDDDQKSSDSFDYWVRVPIANSWDGSDLMPYHKDSYKGSAGLIACSRKFVELAYGLKWQNLAINPIDRALYRTDELCKATWPPETWFDEWQPGYPGYDWEANWQVKKAEG